MHLHSGFLVLQGFLRTSIMNSSTGRIVFDNVLLFPRSSVFWKWRTCLSWLLSRSCPQEAGQCLGHSWCLLFVISLQVPRKGQLSVPIFVWFFVEEKKVTNNLTKPKTFLMSYLKVIFIYFFNSLCRFQPLKAKKNFKISCVYFQWQV